MYKISSTFTYFNFFHLSVESLPDYRIEEVVNKILSKEDKNNDGYIDYSEFIIAQRTVHKEQHDKP